MSTLESRFGSIDYQDQDVLHFPDGLVGFSGLNSFLLLEHKPGSAFRWLQSVDDPAVAFLMADPFVYVPDYAPMIGDGALASLGLTPDTVTFTYVTAAIPHGKPKEMTVNLAGPIVINAETGTGRQLVLDNEAYTTQHRVFPNAEKQGSDAAA